MKLQHKNFPLVSLASTDLREWGRVGLLLLSFMLMFPLYADVITFRVIDAQTHEPIEGAMYECELRWDYGVGRQSGYETDSLGRGEMHFGTDCPRVTLKVECPGYYSAKRVFAISDGTDTLALGDIALKPSEVLLNEAVVTARAKRFTMRGDTVVFNPEAFKLEEGARLEDLLKKLPGVTLIDGELRWNGKPVRILVQGKESLSTDLLTLLPAEAIDKIKGYNKQSEAARKEGHDDGGEDIVLDLQVKEGWLDKWYGEVEAGGFLPVHALAKLNATRLGTQRQTMVFADWNNVGNRFGKKVQSESRSNYGTGKQTYGAGGWYGSWMMPRAKGEDDSHFTVSGDLDHFDQSQDSRSWTETFLSGEAFTRSVERTHNYSHSFHPNISGRFMLRPDSANTFTLNFETHLRRGRGKNNKEGERYDENGALVTQEHTYSSKSDKGGSGTLRAQYTHYFPDKSHVNLSASAYYDNYDSDGTTQRTIDYGKVTTETYNVQTYSRPHHQLHLEAAAAYSRWVGENVQLNAHYQYRYENVHSRQDMLADGLPDMANSYRSHDRLHKHKLSLYGTLNFKPFQIMPDVTLHRQTEWLDFQRGAVDTIATRAVWFVTPSLTTNVKIDNQNKLELRASYSTSLPDLLGTIGYADTSDPLNLRYGNPQLKNSHALNGSLAYTANVVKRQRVITAKLSFNQSSRPVQQLFSYDPQTAVYSSMPTNGRGGWAWTLGFGFDQGLGERWRLRFNNVRVAFGTNYAYLTDTGAGHALNQQRTLSLGGGTELSYERERWEATAFANVEHQGLRNAVTDDYRLWDYSLGVRLLLKLGDFEVKTDFRDEAHRGYGGGYNGDRLLWNASVVWKCLKGQGRLKLSAQDILNQNVPMYAVVNANQHNEVHWTQFHRYVALSFTYNFKPKGKVRVSGLGKQ